MMVILFLVFMDQTTLRIKKSIQIKITNIEKGDMVLFPYPYFMPQFLLIQIKRITLAFDIIQRLEIMKLVK